jgi:hypothetical protein
MEYCKKNSLKYHNIEKMWREPMPAVVSLLVILAILLTVSWFMLDPYGYIFAHTQKLMIEFQEAFIFVPLDIQH